MRADHRYPLLMAEEERQLLAQAQAGDQQARDRLVTCNLGLVWSVARAFRKKGDLDDLVSEGTLALFRAVEKFNLDRQVRFSTYATICVRQKIRRYVSGSERMVRLPEYLLGLIAAWKAAADHLKSTGRRATDEDVAAHLRLSVRRLQTIQRAMRLDRLDVGVLQDAPRHDEDEPDKPTFDAAACLRYVSRREAEVLKRRAGMDGHDPQTLAEIGAHLGIGKERVRQIELTALGKIRAALLPSAL